MDTERENERIHKETFKTTLRRVVGGRRHRDVFESILGRLNAIASEGSQTYTGQFLEKWKVFLEDQEAKTSFETHFGRSMKYNASGFTFEARVGQPKVA